MQQTQSFKARFNDHTAETLLKTNATVYYRSLKVHSTQNQP